MRERNREEQETGKQLKGIKKRNEGRMGGRKERKKERRRKGVAKKTAPLIVMQVTRITYFKTLISLSINVIHFLSLLLLSFLSSLTHLPYHHSYSYFPPPILFRNFSLLSYSLTHSLSYPYFLNLPLS